MYYDCGICKKQRYCKDPMKSRGYICDDFKMSTSAGLGRSLGTKVNKFLWE